MLIFIGGPGYSGDRVRRGLGYLAFTFVAMITIVSRFAGLYTAMRASDFWLLSVVCSCS